MIATHDRHALLLDLLRDLANQTDPGPFDVTIVDDGSVPAVRPRVEALHWPFPLRLIEQDNRGQACARDRGIEASDGEIIIITDDDMQLAPDFLARHRDLHDAGFDVVLGLIRPSDDLADKPIFERFHAAQLERFVQGLRDGLPIPGSALCTGNVSLRRRDYARIGGFDRNLARSEDRDLGIRLQKSGARFAFSEQAYTKHRSDHTSAEVWRRRAFLYGVYDRRIANKHAHDVHNDPWHYLLLVHPLSRPILLCSVVSARAATLLATQALHISQALDGMGRAGVAIKGATLVYGLEYFRGVRSEYDSAFTALCSLTNFLRTYACRRRSGTHEAALISIVSRKVAATKQLQVSAEGVSSEPNLDRVLQLDRRADST